MATASAPALRSRYRRSSMDVLRLPGPHSRFIAKAKRRRMVYQQLDGEILLGEECNCQASWDEWSFFVVRSGDCPVDEHRLHALRIGDKKLRPA